MSKSPLKTRRLELSNNEGLRQIEENPDYTFVLGVVIIPDPSTTRGDVASADVIERAAHGFLDLHHATASVSAALTHKGS